MLEDLEVFGGISARARQQNVISPWMTAHQGFQVVDLVVDDHVPEAQMLMDFTAASFTMTCTRSWHRCLLDACFRCFGYCWTPLLPSSLPQQTRIFTRLTGHAVLLGSQGVVAACLLVCCILRSKAASHGN